jgi:RNA polymerase sporulation-specific sigma factor
VATPTSFASSEAVFEAVPPESPARRPNPRPEPDDLQLVALSKGGSKDATDRLMRRYHGFVRMKASSYFLVGGDSDDLVQEGLLGLYKAIRDFRTDRESSFRNFAELCITRQIITAVKTATRNKHAPLNQYVSFGQSPAANGETETTMEEILPGPTAFDPVNQAISSEELASLVSCLRAGLSEMESSVLGFYLEDRSYEEVAALLGCDTKTVDNALQRVKRKVSRHLDSRDVAV